MQIHARHALQGTVIGTPGKGLRAGKRAAAQVSAAAASDCRQTATSKAAGGNPSQ
jgi:hypothetical protein